MVLDLVATVAWSGPQPSGPCVGYQTEAGTSASKSTLVGPHQGTRVAEGKGHTHNGSGDQGDNLETPPGKKVDVATQGTISQLAEAVAQLQRQLA